jgi:uncharacterized membrane protein
VKHLVTALAVTFTLGLALPAFADGGNLPTAAAIVARGHFLLLHFPLSLLIVALILELALRKRVPEEKRKDVTGALLLVAALGAVIAVVTGLLLAADEEWHGHTEVLMGQHRIGGIITAVLAIATLVAQRRAALKSAYLPMLVVSAIAVSFTGHRGGQLVHGEGYLLGPLGDDDATKKSDSKGDKDKDDVEEPDRIVASDGDESTEEARLRHPEGTVPDKPEYAKHIKPLIDRSCLKCHGPEKRKSGLRLDKKRFAMKGGETGPAIVPGNLTESLFYKYISLPADDEDVMPSKGKLLAQSEIDTVKKWIEQGAEWPDDEK